jgi:hypothetical protein
MNWRAVAKESVSQPRDHGFEHYSVKVMFSSSSDTSTGKFRKEDSNSNKL